MSVGGQFFYINSLDMMLETGLAVLGDVFLKNVLAVFDVGAGEMRFAAREDY